MIFSIWIASRTGFDTALVGLPSCGFILICGIPPYCLGALLFTRTKSQRNADMAFAFGMIIEGLGLIAMNFI